jgi:hypothetical protein
MGSGLGSWSDSRSCTARLRSSEGLKPTGAAHTVSELLRALSRPDVKLRAKHTEVPRGGFHQQLLLGEDRVAGFARRYCCSSSRSACLRRPDCALGPLVQAAGDLDGIAGQHEFRRLKECLLLRGPDLPLDDRWRSLSDASGRRCDTRRSSRAHRLPMPAVIRARAASRDSVRFAMQAAQSTPRLMACPQRRQRGWITAVPSRLGRSRGRGRPP